MNTKTMKSKTLGIILSLVLVLSMAAVVLPATPVQAATITVFTHSPSTSYAGATTTHTVGFTTVTDLPGTGSIKITFPAGFNIAGATLGAVSASFTGTKALTISGQDLTVTRTGGLTVTAGAVLTVELIGIVNTTTSDDYYTTVGTYYNGDYLDGPSDSTTLFAITPAATFPPLKGPVGTTITVTGAGWVSGEGITVTVGAAPAAISLSVNTSGVLSGTITVPTLAPGNKDIVITGTISGAQAFATAFEVTTALAAIAPIRGPVRTTITIITGTGWAPSDTISSVTVGGTAAAKTLVVNASGVLSGTITIPTLIIGVKHIVITGAKSGAQTFTSAFEVTTAAAAFAPVTGPVGTLITVTGTGWGLSDTALSVTVGGTAAIDTLVVDGAGALTGKITVPTGLATGLKTIVITGAISGAQTFTNAFTVTTPATAVFTPTQGRATIATPVTVTGAGWVPSDTITSVTVGGITATGVPSVDVSGALSGGFTVPDTVPCGVHDIVITGAVSGAQTFTNAFTVTMEINLVAGWNLISLPLIPTNTAIATVLAGITPAGKVISVWYYNPLGATPALKWPSWTPAVNDLLTMEAGKGYLINMSSAATMVVNGTVLPVLQNTLPPTYDVSIGYNLIGFKSSAEMHTSVYLPSSALSYRLPPIYWKEAGVWKQLAAADDHMKPGFGYWVYFNAAGTITPPLPLP